MELIQPDMRKTRRRERQFSGEMGILALNCMNEAMKPGRGYISDFIVYVFVFAEVHHNSSISKAFLVWWARCG